MTAGYKRWVAIGLALCLTGCINIKQRISTTERVQITGILTRGELFDKTPIWKVTLTDESVSSIRDALLRGWAATRGVYLVTGDSPLANSYNREFPAFISDELREGAKISVRGSLTAGRIVPHQDRDTALHVLLRISRRRSITVNNDHP